MYCFPPGRFPLLKRRRRNASGKRRTIIPFLFFPFPCAGGVERERSALFGFEGALWRRSRLLYDSTASVSILIFPSCRSLKRFPFLEAQIRRILRSRNVRILVDRGGGGLYSSNVPRLFLCGLKWSGFYAFVCRYPAVALGRDRGTCCVLYGAADEPFAGHG